MFENYVNLTVDQGSDWSTAINFTNADGSALNVYSYSFSSSFKTSYYTPNVAGTINIEKINSGNTGNIILTMNNSYTGNINAGTYVYDLLMTDANNYTTTVMKGQLNMLPGVTANVSIV
jgi:hypothetical protein